MKRNASVVKCILQPGIFEHSSQRCPHWFQVALFIHFLTAVFFVLNRWLITISLRKIMFSSKKVDFVIKEIYQSSIKILLFQVLHFYLEILLISGFIYGIVVLFRRATFHSVFNLVVYGKTVLFLILPLISLILIFKVIFGVSHLQDLSLRIGLNALFPKISSSSFLGLFLASINLVTLLWLYYLINAFHGVFAFGRKHGLYLGIVVFGFYFFCQHFLMLLQNQIL